MDKWQHNAVDKYVLPVLLTLKIRHSYLRLIFLIRLLTQLQEEKENGARGKVLFLEE